MMHSWTSFQHSSRFPFFFLYRKFKTKKDCTIKYESSCELLPSDDSEEMELDLKSDKGRADVTNDVLTESKKEEPKGFPKRKLRSKLNL